MLNRRHTSLFMSTLLVGAALPRSARAQLAGTGDSVCPSGTVLDAITVKTEIATQERSVSFLGFTTSQKVPIRMVTIEVKCRAAPPPPPPPPQPPQQYFDRIFDLDQVDLQRDLVQTLRADSFFTAVNFADGLAQLTATPATFVVSAVALNGSPIAASFPMIRARNGYVFSNPGAVDYWAATTGAALSRLTWYVDGISAVGSNYGRGSFGLSYYLGGVALNAYSGTVSVASSPSGTSTKVVER